MIDPTHLRIGNLVHLMDDEIGHNDTVIEIQRDYAICEEYGSIYWAFVNPVSITPEWLERMGAIFPYSDTRCQIGSLCFYYASGKMYLTDSGFNEKISDQIEYIHTLQNVVHALTSQELTIKP